MVKLENFGVITPKLGIMLSALKDTQDALVDNNLTDLKAAKEQVYLFNNLIIVLENLKNGCDSHSDTLNNSYV